MLTAVATVANNIRFQWEEKEEKRVVRRVRWMMAPITTFDADDNRSTTESARGFVLCSSAVSNGPSVHETFADFSRRRKCNWIEETSRRP